MTDKEFQLLHKDLCARLPYHPIIKIYNDSWEGCQYGEFDNNLSYHHVEAFLCDRIEIELYLRPMSEIANLISAKEYSQLGGIDLIDWYNANHIDYRGLIEKGLAIEAPEGMYNN